MEYKDHLSSESILSILIKKGWEGAVRSYLDTFKTALNHDSKELREALWTAIAIHGQYSIVELLDNHFKKHQSPFSSADLLSVEEKQLIALFFTIQTSTIDSAIRKAKVVAKFFANNFTLDQKEKSVLKYMEYSQISNDVLEAFGLDKISLFNAFLKNIYTTKYFDCRKVDVFKRFSDMGTFLSSNISSGKKLLESFVQLWLTDNIDHDCDMEWSLAIKYAIERYNINIMDCYLCNDGALLYKISKCFCFSWPTIKAAPQKLIKESEEYIFEQFAKTDFLASYNIFLSDNPLLLKNVQNYLSIRNKSPYNIYLVRFFFQNTYGFLRGCSTNPWIERFKCNTLQSKGYTIKQIMSEFKELDDLGVLFFNLGIVDRAIEFIMTNREAIEQTSDAFSNFVIQEFDKFRSVHQISDTYLFTDWLFRTLLSNEAHFVSETLSAIRNKQTARVVLLMQDMPLFTIKKFVDLLADPSYINPEALLLTLKRVLPSNRHLFSYTRRGISIDGTSRMYNDYLLQLLFFSINKALTSSSSKCYYYLTKLCEIPEVQKQLMNETSIERIHEILMLTETSLMPLFASENERREIFNSSNYGRKIFFIWEMANDEIECDDLVNEFLYSNVPGMTIKNKQLIVKIIECCLSIEVPMQLKKWLERF
jgi:hypothetical protein